MYCAVITGPTLTQIQSQIERAERDADLIELRWDLFDSLEYSITSRLPQIFTLRPTSQGGKYDKSEVRRLEAIKKLLVHHPAYLDIEYFVPESFTQECRGTLPSLKIIRSYHDFEKTPHDLHATLQKMQEATADFYKIAGLANSASDTIRMMTFLRQASKNILGICMGEKGTLTRLIGRPWTYCATDANLSAPGQLSLNNLKNKTKAFYGLIGDPVEGSVSHITHNALMSCFDSPSTYLKMAVKSEELEKFFQEIRQFPFHGLSVTMPLKEAVIPYLNTIDSKAKIIGAVNTLLIRDHQLHGFNTDGIGALQAIQEKLELKGKTVIVLGAGGAARAIIYELQQAGAYVIILNRNKEKAELVSKEFGCLTGDSLEAMPNYASKGYDLLINCTPVMPISHEDLLEGCYVMETKTKPMITPFLEAAQKRNCILIYGYEMFVNQAVGQFALWTDWDRSEVVEVLTHYTQAALTVNDDHLRAESTA